MNYVEVIPGGGIYMCESQEPKTLSAGTGGYSNSRSYRLIGADDEVAAYRAALIGVPAFIPADASSCRPATWRTHIDLAEVSEEDNEWFITATFESICGPDDESIEWSTGTATALVMNSFETVSGFEFGTGNSVGALFGGLLNVSHDGEVEGVEIEVPEPEFSLTRCYPPGWTSDCTNMNAIVSCDYHVNSLPWRCFGPREVRFNGVEADGRMINATCDYTTNPELYFGNDTLTLNFSIQPTVQLPIGTDTGGAAIYVTKRGWDNFWTYNVKETISTPTKMQISKPKYGFIERVYPECDFNTQIFP